MGCPGTWAGSEGWVLASTDAIEPPHDAYRVALYQIRPSLPIRPAGKPLAAHSERIKPRFTYGTSVILSRCFNARFLIFLFLRFRTTKLRSRMYNEV